MTNNSEHTCATCEHFVRHYIRQTRGLYCPIKSGHCTYPRIKSRSTDTPACPHFTARTQGEGE